MNAQLQFITDADGKKVSVILPIEDYQGLMEDLAAIAEQRTEATTPWETVKQGLYDDSAKELHIE